MTGTGDFSSGCRAASSSSVPSDVSAGSTPSIDCEKRARACRTSSSAAASIVCVSSRGARPEGVAQRQQNPPDFLGLLLLERDDVVVDLDGAQRLEKQAGAARRRAVDDAGNVAAVLRSDDEHVAAVAFGDDLILEVLRRVLAAEVRLERAAQAGALLPQPIANGFQLRTRVVDDFARRVDLARGRARSPFLNDAAAALARSRIENEAAT